MTANNLVNLSNLLKAPTASDRYFDKYNCIILALITTNFKFNVFSERDLRNAEFQVKQIR